MQVEIVFPPELDAVDKKLAHLREICEWGEENLEDQYKWKYVQIAIAGIRLNHRTESIKFEMDIEEDAMALKLAWC